MSSDTTEQRWFSGDMCPELPRIETEYVEEALRVSSSRDSMTGILRPSNKSTRSKHRKFTSVKSNSCLSKKNVSLMCITVNSSWNPRRGSFYYSRGCNAHPQFLTVLILAVLYITCGACSEPDSNLCAVHLTTPGRTWPPGDIILEDGEPLSIYCILHEPATRPEYANKNASHLAFFHLNKLLPQAYFHIVNRTTIMLHMNRTVPSHEWYYCKMDMSNDMSGERNYSEAVCMNEVTVGLKPQEPKDFSCVSYNWESLVCTWEPYNHYVKTQYSLFYKQTRRAGGRHSYACPQSNNVLENMCFWNISTSPHYRQVLEYYDFNLTATNILGNQSFSYKFHNWAHVIPAPLENFRYVNRTTNSAYLCWKIPSALQAFPPKLSYRISYQDSWNSSKGWKVINYQGGNCEKTCCYHLTGLPYANTIYDVRIESKSRAATDNHSWGSFSSTTFRTAPTVPSLPPRTTIGSYEILKHNRHREVYVYWQTIPEQLENGDNFTYRFINITETGRPVKLKPLEQMESYAKFNISFNDYRFEIVTANEVGQNEEKAVVEVPSLMDTPEEPTAFTKIAFEDGRFELSWNAPRKCNVTSYTIFWCQHERDRPYQCSGYLDWTHVSKSTTVHNVTVPFPDKVYQFAIAANTKTASSGMVWALCTVISNKLSGKMKQVWINHISSNSIQLGWNLDCTNRIDMVEGFCISYCPTISPENNNCSVPLMNTTIKAGPETITGVVRNLKPYTTYKFSITVILAKNDSGPASDWLYNKTLQAPPSPVQSVNITHITNTSMLVQWKKPKAMNGVLQYYQVKYNDREIPVKGPNTSIELTNLLAHTRYTVNVSACTVDCSNVTPIHVTTAIGTPGNMSKPVVRFTNSTTVEVSWEPPMYPAGPIAYYEILTGEDSLYSNLTGTVTLLPIPNCGQTGSDKLNKFSIRAVNKDANGELLYGAWSPPGEGNCFNSGPSGPVWIIIYIIGSLSGVALLLFALYASKRLWLKCQEMQDVEVKLPPGLTSNTTLLDKSKDQHPQKMSAESSGCSSGQESVTSSLTSDSRVSADSGTEVDQIPASPEKLLESPPSWETSTLRQRNVGSTKPESAERDSWDPYVKVPKSTDATLVDALSSTRSTPNLTDTAMTGYTTSQQTWPSTGYISMPSSDDVSSSPSPGSKVRSHGGGYSVVGIAPKELRFKTSDDVGSRTGNLIPLASDTTPIKHPYITLASLEQKKLSIPLARPPSSLEDLGDLQFNEPLAPFSISDKLSKPYVQTGFADASRKPFSIANPLRQLHPTVEPEFFSTPTQHCSPIEGKSLADVSLPTPYVAISSLSDLPKNVESKQRDSVDALLDDGYSFACQQQEQLEDKSRTAASSTEDLASGGFVSVPIAKHPSGYVTIVENAVQSKGFPEPQATTTSQYVPHQRLKVSPINRESVGQSDEQYSKVTVVPTSK